MRMRASFKEARARQLSGELYRLSSYYPRVRSQVQMVYVSRVVRRFCRQAGKFRAKLSLERFSESCLNRARDTREINKRKETKKR
jgi:hypothetical protein